MKNNKIFYVVTLLLLTLNCKAQSQAELVSNYSNDIIGLWISDSDNTIKKEFTIGGLCRYYLEDELISVFSYSIETSCGDDNINSFVYLKIIDHDNESYCFEINRVNYKLSLTNLTNGNIEIYIKL